MQDITELENALKEWEDKLVYLEAEEPKVSDIDQKYNIHKSKIKAKEMIHELEDKIKLCHEHSVPIIVIENSADNEEIQIPIKKVDSLLQDHPPVIQNFVGRNDLIETLQSPNIHIAAITGLGGEGKSSLAAKIFDLALTNSTSIKYDKLGWCNCKELENPFHDKLKSLLEYMTDGEENMQKNREESFPQTVHRFTRMLNHSHCLIVFDNMDSFVDIEGGAFIANLKYLFDTLATSLSKSLVIFTCRVPIEDYHSIFIEIPVKGLKYEEAKELAQDLKVLNTDFNESALEEVYAGTKGHALWLNLIFGQIRSNRIDARKAKELVKNSSGSLDRILLSSIWNNLNADEREVILAISGFTTRHDISKVEKITKFNSRRCNGILKSLIRLSLVIEVDASGTRHYDLHPIIKVKAKNECPADKKVDLYKSAIFILSNGGQWDDLLSIINFHETYTPQIDGFVECVEIAIENNEIKSAIDFLQCVSEALLRLGEITKFLNLTKELLKILNLKASGLPDDNPKFIAIYLDFIECLADVGEFEQAKVYIEDYRKGMKTFSQYIHFVEMNSFFLWQYDKFQEALDFINKEIVIIKDKNEAVPEKILDTMNLCKRDLGRVDEVLTHYVSQEIVDNINTWEPKVEGDISSNDLGNLSRCYFLLEKYEISLKLCLASYTELKKEKNSNAKINQGYALLWLTDIFIKLNQFEDANENLKKAFSIWKKYCPSRLDKIKAHYLEYPTEFKEQYILPSIA